MIISTNQCRRLGLHGYAMWLCEVNGYEFSESIILKDIGTVHASVRALQESPMEEKVAPMEEEVVEAPVINPQSDNPFPTELQQYDSLTVAELREMCKAQDLPIYGTKAEIILRLKQNDEGIIPILGDTDGPTEDVAPEVKPEAPTDEVAASNGSEPNDQEDTSSDKQEPNIEE